MSTSSMRKMSVSRALRWIDAFRLSMSCELAEHELDGGQAVARVTIENREERPVPGGRFIHPPAEYEARDYQQAAVA